MSEPSMRARIARALLGPGCNFPPDFLLCLADAVLAEMEKGPTDAMLHACIDADDQQTGYQTCKLLFETAIRAARAGR